MKKTLLLAPLWLRACILREDGQDLIEYALVVALIAFGVTASMSVFASEVGTLFSSINFHMTV